MRLAHDVGAASLTLGIQAVELLLQPLFGRFACIDRAAKFLGSLSHPRPHPLRPTAVSGGRRTLVLTSAHR